MTNSQEIFSIALGLESPWQISSITFDKDRSRLDIHLSFIKGLRSTKGLTLYAYGRLAVAFITLIFRINK